VGAHHVEGHFHNTAEARRKWLQRREVRLLLVEELVHRRRRAVDRAAGDPPSVARRACVHVQGRARAEAAGSRAERGAAERAHASAAPRGDGEAAARGGARADEGGGDEGDGDGSGEGDEDDDAAARCCWARARRDLRTRQRRIDTPVAVTRVDKRRLQKRLAQWT
jgi:hypothetical protein